MFIQLDEQMYKPLVIEINIIVLEEEGRKQNLRFRFDLNIRTRIRLELDQNYIRIFISDLDTYFNEHNYKTVVGSKHYCNFLFPFSQNIG